MATKPQSRYQRLVAGFAASAFALLTMLSIQQHEANTVTAEVVRHPAVMTNYRNGCLVIKNKNQRLVTNNYRFCKTK